MTRKAIADFNERRLNTQYVAFGVPVVYLGHNLTGCHTAVMSNKELRDGGFALIHDFTCRLRKSDFPGVVPAAEKEITVADVVYRIAEVINHPLAGEWKLGLRSAS